MDGNRSCFSGEKADEASGILGDPYPAPTTTSGPGNPLFHLAGDASGQLAGLALCFSVALFLVLACLPSVLTVLQVAERSFLQEAVPKPSHPIPCSRGLP